MKRSKFSEEQVAYPFRQADAGTALVDVCRQLGISEATSYVWEKRWGHPGVHARDVLQVSQPASVAEANARWPEFVTEVWRVWEAYRHRQAKLRDECSALRHRAAQMARAYDGSFVAVTQMARA